MSDIRPDAGDAPVSPPVSRDDHRPVRSKDERAQNHVGPPEVPEPAEDAAREPLVATFIAPPSVEEREPPTSAAVALHQRRRSERFAQDQESDELERQRVELQRRVDELALEAQQISEERQLLARERESLASERVVLEALRRRRPAVPVALPQDLSEPTRPPAWRRLWRRRGPGS